MVIAFKILLLLIPLTTYSAVFTQNHTKVLFTEIDGWVRGEINDISYNKIENEKVFTLLSLKVTEFSGLSQAQITNKRNFKIYYPGGKWQGINITYSGGPKFSVGDDYVFLLNKRRGGYFVNGFSAGAIKVVKANDSLINELKQFSELKFNQIHLVGSKTSRPIIKSINKKRSPAARINTQNELSPVENDIYIMMVLFLILLLIFLYLFVGRSETTKK